MESFEALETEQRSTELGARGKFYSEDQVELFSKLAGPLEPRFKATRLDFMMSLARSSSSTEIYNTNVHGRVGVDAFSIFPTWRIREVSSRVAKF